MTKTVKIVKVILYKDPKLDFLNIACKCFIKELLFE